MMTKPREECGVFGIYAPRQPVATLTYYALYALQHRGQESAGIAVSDGREIQVHKARGLVSEVFSDDQLQDLASFPGSRPVMAVGHVRYGGREAFQLANIQPLVVYSGRGMLALAMNGRLANGPKLRAELAGWGTVFQSTSDAELVIHLLAQSAEEDILKAAVQAMHRLQGGYGLVFMTEQQVVGMRDPYGIRPLCIGKLGEFYCLASESCALDTIGAEFVRDVAPGEVVAIGAHGLVSLQGPQALSPAHCSFEYVYFARPDSTLDGINVGESRVRMGMELYLEHPIDADVVIPVPDSGTAAALGYAAASGLPFAEGLMKNRYVGRTFIQPTQAMREVAVRIKLNANASFLKGKRVVMVDDSIVRGTTSSKLIELVKKAGAEKVHLLISSPPVRHACPYGIDTTERESLIASRLDVEEIRELVGADSLHYLSEAGLRRALGDRSLCLACFTGECPAAEPHSLTYRQSGVDIDAGNRFVELIKPMVGKTARSGVLGGIGGFGGMFQVDLKKYHDPVLVAGADGVGTKLKLAFALNKHDTIGIDAVAMCVNDVLTHGAEPLFFLDYLAVGKLNPEEAAQVVKGIVQGCEAAGCALLGGETAEMPGFYRPGEYDVAGFAVGAVNREDIIDGRNIAAGDVVLGLSSSGLHSNGYSLVRRVFAGWDLKQEVPELGEPLGEALLRPTRIYVQPILQLLAEVKVKGMAHITGGGLTENLARIFPRGLGLTIARTWQVPPIFTLIQRLGKVSPGEMYRTFNMGIGFAVVVSPEDVDQAVAVLRQAGESPVVLGTVEQGEGVRYR